MSGYTYIQLCLSKRSSSFHSIVDVQIDSTYHLQRYGSVQGRATQSKLRRIAHTWQSLLDQTGRPPTHSRLGHSYTSTGRSADNGRPCSDRMGRTHGLRRGRWQWKPPTCPGRYLRRACRRRDSGHSPQPIGGQRPLRGDAETASWASAEAEDSAGRRASEVRAAAGQSGGRSRTAEVGAATFHCSAKGSRGRA